MSGTIGATYLNEFLGVLPLGPTDYTPPQLLKLTVPVVTVHTPGQTTNLGDTQLLDFWVNKTSWGAWTAGPGLVIPSNAPAPASSGRWQLGLLGGFVYSGFEGWQMGLIAENFWSVGSSSNPPVNQLSLAPTFTYTNKQGWFFGLTDFSWTFNWEQGGASVIPVGPQVGRVFKLFGQAISLSAEVGWNVGSTRSSVSTPTYAGPLPKPIYAVELIFLFPER